MKIESVQLHFVRGIMPEGYRSISSYSGDHVRPTSIYGQKKKHDRSGGTVNKGGSAGKEITQAFLEVVTDDGIIGRVGPVQETEVRDAILNKYGKVIIGMDPLDNELIWDLLYRYSVSSYAGVDMEAISAIDIALWDIKAKAAHLPLYKLIGGTVQKSLPAYFNSSGYVLDEIKFIETMDFIKSQGFQEMKFNAMTGPRDGKKGMERTEATLRAIRETMGPDFKIMLDASCSWDYDYAMQILPRLEPFDLFWIEEPLMPQCTESYARLRGKSPIRIATGEHLYTRWGFKPYLDTDAADIYQPEPYYCGGITETLKIMALCDTYDKQIAFHGCLPAISVQLSAVRSSLRVISAENFDLLSRTNQYFLKTPYYPTEGFFTLGTEPGAGMELDPEKIIDEWYG